MHNLLLPIDTKSLYYNIQNDNLKGHTCTVATPIKQGGSTDPLLSQIYKIPRQIDFQKSDTLLRDLTKNSKSVTKVNNVFVFDKLKVNGFPLSVGASYCIYTKEEIDKERAQYGRVKLHYPISLKNEEYEIDNRKVINAISEHLFNHAFIVESFCYCFDDDSFNFNVLVVGYTNIPYSKVFINNKGAGSKYNISIKNHFDVYDSEIISLRERFGSDVNTDNFTDYLECGRDEAKRVVADHLKQQGCEMIRDVSREYPYSVFDFQYYSEGKLKYCIVAFTYTRKRYFNLSYFQNLFVNKFENSFVAIVTDVGNDNNIEIVDRKGIENYSATMDVVRFVERE